MLDEKTGGLSRYSDSLLAQAIHNYNNAPAPFGFGQGCNEVRGDFSHGFDARGRSFNNLVGIWRSILSHWHMRQVRTNATHAKLLQGENNILL